MLSTIVLTELCHLRLPQGPMGIAFAQHSCLHRLQSSFLLLSLFRFLVRVLVLCSAAGFPPPPPSSDTNLATGCGFDLCFPKWLTMWSNSHSLTHFRAWLLSYSWLWRVICIFWIQTTCQSCVVEQFLSPEMETFHPTGKLFKQGDKITSRRLQEVPKTDQIHWVPTQLSNKRCKDDSWDGHELLGRNRK